MLTIFNKRIRWRWHNHKHGTTGAIKLGKHSLEIHFIYTQKGAMLQYIWLFISKNRKDEKFLSLYNHADMAYEMCDTSIKKARERAKERAHKLLQEWHDAINDLQWYV